MIAIEGNEPGLAKKIILESGIYNFKAPIYIFTNGTTFNKEDLMQMPKNVIFRISLDGPQILHDKNRITKNGKGTFSKVMDFISLCQQEGFSFDIGTTITEESQFYLHEMKKLFASIPAQSFCLTVCDYPNDRPKTKKVFDSISPVIEGWNDKKIKIFNPLDNSDEEYRDIEVYFHPLEIQIHNMGFRTINQRIFDLYTSSKEILDYVITRL